MKHFLRHIAQRLACFAGASIIPTTQYQTWHHQRLALLTEAANLYRDKLTDNGTLGYVFSFNRPVQLHACLASYFHHAKNPVPLVVQYGAKSPEADKVYDEVKTLFKKQPVTFVKETKCRDTFIAQISAVQQRKIFFLMDDIVFINGVDMAQYTAINPLQYVPTLRMHPQSQYCYTMNVPQPAPKTLSPSKAHPPMLQWSWGDAGNEWDCPCSLDGNLFDTAEIVMMSRASPWKAPNTLEGMMYGFAALLRTRPGLCYQTPVIFNNPCNKVQTEMDNRAGQENAFSPEQFLAEWAKGNRIAYEALSGLITKGPHQEVAFQFVPR